MHYLALIAIIVLGIYLRYYYLFQPMRYDEAYTFIKWAQNPIKFIISDYSSPNNHIFHTLLVHFSYRLLGLEPWKLRLPAFIAGCLIIPATYLLFRLLYNKKTALLASGSVTVSSLLIEFSTNARGYTLVTFIFLLIFLLAYYLIHNQNLWGWIAFSFLSALGFYTVPVFLYPFGVVSTWTFFSTIKENSPQERNKNLLLLLLSVLLTALLTSLFYLPVIQHLGIKALIANRFVLPLPFGKFISDFSNSIVPNLKLFHRDIPSFPSFLLLSGFVLSLIFHRKIASHKIPVILAVLSFMLPVILIQRVVPYNRIYLFLFPLYYGSASAGLCWLIEKSTSVFQNQKIKNFIFYIFTFLLTLTLGACVILNQTVYYSSNTGSYRDGEKVTLFFKSYLKREDKIFAPTPSWAVLEYYFIYHKLPLNHFFNLKKNKPIIAVLRKETKYYLQDYNKLKKRGFNPPDYHFKLIKSFEESNLYLLEPKQAQSSSLKSNKN